MESHLNPDAPEFVPDVVKVCSKNLEDEVVISSSPLKNTDKSVDDISTFKDFHKGIIECAGEFNKLNGVQPLDSNNHLENEKNNLANIHSDDNEISSTKAECDDNSAFNFGTSVNTKALLSEVPQDYVGSTDVLFSNDNDFDPSMDAPKELQDLVSSPEPDETLIPGTPRSTVAEASASPINLDTLPSQFMEFDAGKDVPVDQSGISSFNAADLFGFEPKVDVVVEEEEPEQPLAPLTFAEVLKRPSPRTSPEPPIEDIIIEEEKVLNGTNPFAQETKDLFVDDGVKGLDNVEIEIQKIEGDDVVIDEIPKQIVILDDDIEDVPCETVGVETNADSFDFTKEDDKPESEIAFMMDTSLPSFVTVRNSLGEDQSVEFSELKSPEDENPPQLFRVDDNMKHFDAVEEPKISAKEDLMASFFPEKTAENLQFLSHNTDDNLVEPSSDLEIAQESTIKHEQIGITPEEIQVETVDPGLKFNGVQFLEAINSKVKSNEFEDSPAYLEVKENHFDIKTSPTEIRDVVEDFKVNDSHFEEKSSDVFKDHFESNLESKFDAQEIPFSTADVTVHLVESETVSNKNEFTIPDSLPVNGSKAVFDDLNVFQEDEILNDNTHNDLPNEIVSQNIEEVANEFVDISAVLKENNIEETQNLFTSHVESDVVSELVSEQIIIEQLSSAPVKQQEETLEQTINVDFIPAEPLTTIENKEEKLEIPVVSLPTETSEDVEKPKDEPSTTETPPSTPAPGVNEAKPEEQEGLLVAVAAAAAAGAAVTAGVVAAKVAAKKTTSTTATKKPGTTATGPKKPSDLAAKTTTKTSIAAKTTSKAAVSSLKPAGKTTLVGAKTAAKPLATKSPTTTRPAVKSATPPSKPSTPTSKPTTPTSISRPSSATKTSPTKPGLAARTTTVKPKSTVTDKPLTNGDVPKPGVKKTETIPARKPLTSTVSKTTAAKPIASKVTSTQPKSAVSSTTKTATTANSLLNKTKPTATSPRPATTLNANKTKPLTGKLSDKTGKDNVNKLISSTVPRTGITKVSPKPNLKKTDCKLPEKNSTAKSPVASKPVSTQ